MSLPKIYAMFVALLIMLLAVNLNNISNTVVRLILTCFLSWFVYLVCYVALIKIVIIRGIKDEDES